MKNENLEKYIGDLSPEMQEKARQCKTMEELQAMLAENDVYASYAGRRSQPVQRQICRQLKNISEEIQKIIVGICPSGLSAGLTVFVTELIIVKKSNADIRSCQFITLLR